MHLYFWRFFGHISYCLTYSMSTYVCSSLKFKPTIKNIDTINCIIRPTILVALSSSQTGQPLICLHFSWNMLPIMIEIFPSMLALCHMLYYIYASIINAGLALHTLNYCILIYIIILFVTCTVGVKKINVCNCNYAVITNYVTLWSPVITIVSWL